MFLGVFYIYYIMLCETKKYLASILIYTKLILYLKTLTTTVLNNGTQTNLHSLKVFIVVCKVTMMVVIKKNFFWAYK